MSDALKNYRYAPDETGRFRNYLTGILKHKALYRRKMAERHAKSVAAVASAADVRHFWNICGINLPLVRLLPVVV